MGASKARKFVMAGPSTWFPFRRTKRGPSTKERDPHLQSFDKIHDWGWTNAKPDTQKWCEDAFGNKIPCAKASRSRLPRLGSLKGLLRRRNSSAVDREVMKEFEKDLGVLK